MTIRYVLVGYAAELSLRPLAAALRATGAPVSLVDLAEEPATPAAVPPASGPVVLVTSQHLGMTGSVYGKYYPGLPGHYTSPQALRDRLGADLLVYVPHDLSEPVPPGEVELLRTVDLYAAPDADSWWAAAHVPTVVVGWVGTAWWDEAAIARAPLSRGVLFLTQVQWLELMGGGEYVLGAWADTLATGLAVKLPVWPGMEGIVTPLEAAGVPILDPALSAAAIARNTPLVVTSGPSSVLSEAVEAGHRPVCVLSAEGAREFGGQLGALDVAVCWDAGFRTTTTSAGVVREPGARFDVPGFVAAVQDALRRKQR